MDSRTLAGYVEASGGKFVTVTFVKKDGTLRKLTGRMGVTKHLKGGQSTLNPEKHITVYDVQSKGYRAINKDTIQSIVASKQTFAA